jgi:very-short-patch-repair endonuclease
LDGVRWHLPAQRFEKDHAKRARLQAAGWTVLAYTWRMVIDDPSAVIRSLRSVLGPQRVQNVRLEGPKSERASAA